MTSKRVKSDSSSAPMVSPANTDSTPENAIKPKKMKLRTPQHSNELKNMLRTPLKPKNPEKNSIYFRPKFNPIATNLTFESSVVVFNMSKSDEQTLNSQAEAYVTDLDPDPDYYDIENGRKVYFMMKMCSKQTMERQNENDGRGNRKRKSYDNIECYVSHYEGQSDCRECPLPEGTKLSKPTTKLVELVARVVFHAPNGMLQVQQVYVALQNRYPYFRFMHKTAINSWKSSIRHALYQKWFYKVRIVTGYQTESKGCYWALNTCNSPREWEMPGPKDRNGVKTVEAKAVCTVERQRKDDDVIGAIDLTTRRREESNSPAQSVPLVPQKSKICRNDGIVRKAKRRLDMSGGENEIAPHGIVDDLLGVAPLSPSPDATPGNCGIPMMPCALGVFDENSVFFYPNGNVLQRFANRLRHCVWWDGERVSTFRPVRFSSI